MPARPAASPASGPPRTRPRAAVAAAWCAGRGSAHNQGRTVRMASKGVRRALPASRRQGRVSSEMAMAATKIDSSSPMQGGSGRCAVFLARAGCEVVGAGRAATAVDQVCRQRFGPGDVAGDGVSRCCAGAAPTRRPSPGHGGGTRSPVPAPSGARRPTRRPGPV